MWPNLARAASLGLLANLVLLGVVFACDTLNLESVAASSGRLYARVQRLRGRQLAGESATGKTYRRALPSLPFLGGIGPVAWRQLLSGLRNPGRLILLALLLVLLLAGPLVAAKEEAEPPSHLALVFGVLILA